MINGFYAAKSGAKSYQARLDVTANNIANVNTQGYKAQQISFTDLIYTNAQGADFLVGNGTRVAATTVNAEQGGLGQDGLRSVAIKGEGFFALVNGQNDPVYTRTGDFALSVENNAIYLTTSDGSYVLDQNEQHIQVTDGDIGAAVNRAALYTFPNPEELQALGDNHYAATNASGAAAVDEESQIVGSAYELSNVDLTSEITHMMLAQRGMQLSMRMIQTADELEQTVNNLRT